MTTEPFKVRLLRLQRNALSSDSFRNGLVEFVDNALRVAFFWFRNAASVAEADQAPQHTIKINIPFETRHPFGRTRRFLSLTDSPSQLCQFAPGRRRTSNGSKPLARPQRSAVTLKVYAHFVRQETRTVHNLASSILAGANG